MKSCLAKLHSCYSVSLNPNSQVEIIVPQTPSCILRQDFSAFRLFCIFNTVVQIDPHGSVYRRDPTSQLFLRMAGPGKSKTKSTLFLTYPDGFKRLGIAQIVVGLLCIGMKIGVYFIAGSEQHGLHYYFLSDGSRNLAFVPMGLFVGILSVIAGGLAFTIATHLTDKVLRSIPVGPKVRIYRYFSGGTLFFAIFMGCFNAYLARLTSDWFSMCMTTNRFVAAGENIIAVQKDGSRNVDFVCRMVPLTKYGLFVLHLFLALAGLAMIIMCIVALTRYPAIDGGFVLTENSVAASIPPLAPPQVVTAPVDQGNQPLAQPYGYPTQPYPQPAQPYPQYQQYAPAQPYQQNPQPIYQQYPSGPQAPYQAPAMPQPPPKPVHQVQYSGGVSGRAYGDTFV